MKIVKKNNEICHFYTCEKSLFVAWACFRNERKIFPICHRSQVPQQYSPILTSEGSMVRRNCVVAREIEIRMKYR